MWINEVDHQGFEYWRCFFSSPNHCMGRNWLVLNRPLEISMSGVCKISSAKRRPFLLGSMHWMNLHHTDWRRIYRECKREGDILLSVWCQLIPIPIGILSANSSSECFRHEIPLEYVHNITYIRIEVVYCDNHVNMWLIICGNGSDILTHKILASLRHLSYIYRIIGRGDMGKTRVYTITYGHVLRLCSFRYIIQTFLVICYG